MRLRYHRLSSGYHYVVDETAAHRFAQWRIGTELHPHDVSHNGCTMETLLEFIHAARQLADARELIPQSSAELRTAFRAHQTRQEGR